MANMDRLRQIAKGMANETERKRSLEVTKRRQQAMLPELPTIEGVEFHAHYQPCAEVSGDFYDFIPIRDNVVGVALGDVAGHGMEAGFIMGMAKKALQIYARGIDDPLYVCSITNEDISKDLVGETFVSVGYGILDTSRMTFKYVRAGHNPAYLYNPLRQPSMDILKPPGMVIGIDKIGDRFKMLTRIEEVVLQQGDLIFQYTDGLLEAFDERKIEFGEERILNLIRNNWHLTPEQLNEQMINAVTAHVGDKPFQDDITIISIKIN